MDREGLSYLHVLNADRIEDVTKTLSNILQEAAENNSPDVDTLWKIITHLWNKIYFSPPCHRSPIIPLEQIPLDSILSAEDIRTRKYASFILTVYSWLVFHHQTNTDGQALSDIGRYKPGLDEETKRYLDKTATGRFINSAAHYFLIQGVFERCAQRGKFYGAKYALEKWEREEEERKKKEEQQKEQEEQEGQERQK